MSDHVPPGSSTWAPRAGYRRHTYRPAQPPAHPQTVDWTPQADRLLRRSAIALWVLGALGVVGFLIVLGVIYATAGQELSRLLLPIALAFVPLLIVLSAAGWIDRWEPEPLGALAAAFLWGAGVSTVVSLVVNTSATVLVAQATGSLDGGTMVSTVVTAPIIEELTKGLGVLIIFLLRRRAFNGAVDGLVYASVIAGGFAFAENILYFVRYSDVIVQTFIMRGIASPFAHVIFTACTGIAIGSSARMRSRLAWVWVTPIGLAGAIILHAFWNGVLAAAPTLYFLVAMPFFMASVGLVVWLRWSERMTMRSRLGDYQRAGWFAPAEVTMITTGSGRAAARRWAKGRGEPSRRAMRDFLKASSALAQLRQQAIDGHAEADFATHEQALLRTVVESRKAFTAR
ncbi:PrsW family intramembrane metalloprotease [Actinomyces howellii]|uniref:Protease prsW n=1 Tax=Actinomyces howellii TaxID=52771 RepID=A0A3S4UVP6_9ACTO|nr:PrsW family intramembrane metalloprotease [Actinomyces howellii]VEG25932.1 Uncharacterised protein [Actinomyces howellii]